jgi:predicted helicase
VPPLSRPRAAAALLPAAERLRDALAASDGPLGRRLDASAADLRLTRGRFADAFAQVAACALATEPEGIAAALGAAPLPFAALARDLAERRRGPAVEALRALKEAGAGSSGELLGTFEAFFARWAAASRARHGVFFTPAPIAEWLLDGADELLREAGIGAGLAAPEVRLVEPSCGGGAFLAPLARRLGPALLPRLHAFELMPASWAVAHLVLARTLGLEAAPETDLRLGDALDEANARSVPVGAEDVPVVIGNPPFAGYSANARGWIDGLLEPWKETVRGEERQIQRLSNDYVKFLRLATWQVERARRGVVALVTDRGWLEGVLFRDLRRSLATGFDEVRVLDLHGDSIRRSARTPRGDRSVFDITQGVALVLLLRSGRGCRRVRHAERFGSREEKLASLADDRWTEAEPRAPTWSLSPSARSEYDDWVPLPAILGNGSKGVVASGTGVKTRHDAFAIAFTPEEAVSQVRALLRGTPPGLCTTTHFDLERARRRAAEDGLADHVRPIAYRPFDTRFAVHLREFVCEPKRRLMSHLDAPSNLALCVLRRDRAARGVRAFVARGLVSKDLVSNVDDAQVWPLWLEAHAGRRANVAPRVLDAIGRPPEDVFAWIYALLHSPRYTGPHADRLREEFPRLPPFDAALVPVGRELIALHLLEAPLDLARFEVAGDGSSALELPRLEDGALHLGSDLRIDGVPDAVWQHAIGAYRPCERWLLERRGRTLSAGELMHFRRMLAALERTRALIDLLDRPPARP